MPENETRIIRITRTKEEAKTSYDKMSKWYDILIDRFERKYKDAGLKMLGVKEGEIVLEVGFGTGNCILALGQAVGGSGEVYGVDISEGMCNVARSKVEKAGLSERVKLKCGDGAELSFEANFFNAVFMSFTLELFDTPEIPIVLHECQKVLQRGGRICVVAMSKKEKDSFIVRLYEWTHRKLPNYVDCRPIFVQKALEAAGFQILDVKEVSMWRLPVEIALARKKNEARS